MVIWNYEGFQPLTLSLMLQAAGALLGALGVFLGGGRMRMGLMALAAGLVASVLVGLVTGLQGVAMAFAQIAAIVVGVGGLGYLIKLATESDPDAS